jgi:Bacterial mobilisation protein (MobC)
VDEPRNLMKVEGINRRRVLRKGSCLSFTEKTAKCRIAYRLLLAHIVAMTADSFIHCRVSAATKEALRAAAERQQLSESALVKRMIEMILHAAARPDVTPVPSSSRPTRATRLFVRLSLGDWALLRDRAAARSVPSATYASNLIRAHVRGVSPLVKDELQALRRSIAALGAIGNNLNQIARVSHQSGHVSGPSREDLRAVIKVCEGLRDHVHGLMRTNVMSWQSGDAPAHH